MFINPGSPIGSLIKVFPHNGEVVWLGIRKERRTSPILMEVVEAIAGKGLTGDHYAGKSGTRQVTLIQYEHIMAIASFLNLDYLDPGLLRRNIVIKGINLLALKERKFRVGAAILEMTGQCHPCSRMEENLGPGGYNAMRNHGGITARILKSGLIKLYDPLIVDDNF